MEKAYPLSGRGKEITYELVGNTRNVKWGDTRFKLSDCLINDISENFFIETDRWCPLGADEVSPMPGGLGDYLKKTHKGLTPRHASAIAAIMHHEEFISYKDGKPILLKKVELSNPQMTHNKRTKIKMLKASVTGFPSVISSEIEIDFKNLTARHNLCKDFELRKSESINLPREEITAFLECF